MINERAEGNAGKIIRRLSALDCVIFDELGYIPFPKAHRRALCIKRTKPEGNRGK
jgi:DNA replication protein DnaC